MRKVQTPAQIPAKKPPITREMIRGLQGKYADIGPSTSDLEAERRADRLREDR
jgi:hypothetical protein